MEGEIPIPEVNEPIKNEPNQQTNQPANEEQPESDYKPTYQKKPELKMFTQCIHISEFSSARIEESVYPRETDFAKDFATIEKREMFKTTFINLPKLTKVSATQGESSPQKSEQSDTDQETSDDRGKYGIFQTLRYAGKLSTGDSEEDTEERFFPSSLSNNDSSDNSSLDFEDCFNISGDEEEEEETLEENRKEEKFASTYEEYKNIEIKNKVKVEKPSAKNLLPEIKQKYSNESEISIDSVISDALKEKKILQNTTIDVKIVNEIVNEKNEIFSKTAGDYKNYSPFNSHPVISAFSDKMKVLSFIKKPHEPEENVSMDPIFVSEVPSLSSPPVLEDSQYDVSRSFMKSTFVYENGIIGSLPRPKEFQKFNFALLSLTGFDIGCDFIEPIVCSAFLYGDGKILTERWNFAPTQSVEILKKYGINYESKSRGAFELGEEEAYLVIEIRRPLLVGNGTSVDAYYQSGNSPKNLSKAQQCINASFPRTKDIFTTFACTAVPVGRITSSDQGLQMPKPIIIDQPASYEVIGEVIKTRNAQAQSLPWNITICGQLTKALNARKIQDDGYYVMNQISPVCNPFKVQFMNKMFFRLDAVNFKPPRKVKARNIFAKISLRNSTTEVLPLIYSPITGKRDYFINTNVWYHNEKPTFYETFSCDIPYPLPQGLYFEVDFYHGIAQTNDKSCSPICKAYVKLTDESGIFLPEKHKVSVFYDEKDDITGMNFECPNAIVNYIEFTTHIRSSFYSQDPYMQKALLETCIHKCVNNATFEKISKEAIKEHLFEITSILVSLIPRQPWRVVNAFCKLAEIGASYIGEDFSALLETFALKFAFAESGSFVNAHTPLLLAYGEYIRTHKNNEDKDLLDFFFILILKSLMLSNDKTYMTAIEIFTTLWMRDLFPMFIDLAQKRLDHYIWFVVAVFEVGKYSAASQLIRLFIQHGFDKLKHVMVIERFMRKALSPKLFYVLSVYSNPFRDMYMSMITRIFGYLNDEYFSSVYNALLKNTMMYTHEMNQTLADRYGGLKGFKSPLQGAFYCEPYFGNISRDEFDTYWNNTDHKGFFRMFHNYLVVFDYKGTEIPTSDNERRQKEIIHAIQRGMIGQIRLLARVSNPDDISEITLLYFHLITSNVAIDNLGPLFVALAELLTLNNEVVAYRSHPILPFIIKYVLLDSSIDSYSASVVIDSLFPKDMTNRAYGRSLAIIALTVIVLKAKECQTIKLNMENEKADIILQMLNITGYPIENTIKKFVETEVFAKMDDPTEAREEFEKCFAKNKSRFNEPLPKFK